jgi:hypothetical protein
MAVVFAGTPSVGSAQTAPDTLVARCDLPVLDLFNPNPGDVVPTGEYQISGMAVDPMAPDGSSGIDLVSFFIGNRDLGGVQIGSVTPMNGQRLADFSTTVDIPATDVGKQVLLVAFARSALSGKETQISTPVILGRHPSPTSPGPTQADTINTNPGTLPETCTPDVSTMQLNPPAALNATGVNLGAPRPVTAVNNSMVGTIVGAVSSCMGGDEKPLTQVTVSVQGTSATAQSDFDGEFSIGGVPAPGTYTVAVSDGAVTATRMYVPVAPGETIDIGTLSIAPDPMAGCDADNPL